MSSRGRQSPSRDRSKTIRISGLVSLAQQTAAEVTLLGRHSADELLTERLRRLSSHAENHSRRVMAMLAAQGHGPADLPTPSRHALQLLGFLAKPAQSLSAAATVARIVRLAAMDRRQPVLGELMLYPSRSLFRSRRNGSRLDLTMHIAFADAPDAVLDSAVRAARGARDCLPVVRSYALTDAYKQRVADLEALMGGPPQPSGRVYDLHELFERVNQRYFQGNLEAPALRWSSRQTYRKMGHYDAVRDTVVISRSLDRPEAPPLLLEFVMFHELLHKAMGVKVVRGRARAHTPAFRRAERRFVGYDHARKLLDEYASRLR